MFFTLYLFIDYKRQEHYEQKRKNIMQLQKRKGHYVQKGALSSYKEKAKNTMYKKQRISCTKIKGAYIQFQPLIKKLIVRRLSLA